MGTIKNLIDNYYGWNDTEKEPPAGGIRRVGYILINYPGKIFIANLLFLICCIPVVTIPAAYMALNHYLVKIYQKGYGFSLEDYWGEFKESVVRRLPLGILAGFLCFYGYYLLSLASNFADGNMRAAVAGIGIAFAAAGLLIGSYTFMLSAMTNLTNRAIIKDAMILIFAEWGSSIGTLVIAGLTVAIVTLLVPYSLFVALVGIFAVQQLGICAFIYPAVQKRIVEPYEMQQRIRN